MNRNVGVLVGILVLAWYFAGDVKTAAEVGAQVTYASGTVVKPPAELSAQMSNGTRLGYVAGSEWAGLALTDTLTCKEAAAMGLRGAMQTNDVVTKAFYAIRDAATGAIDC